MRDFLIEIFSNFTSNSNVESVVDFVINIVKSVLVIIIGLLINVGFQKFIKNTIKKNAKLNVDGSASKTFMTIILNVGKYVIYFLIFLEILTIYGVKTTSVLTVAGFGSVAIAFGAQSLVADLISGISILLEGTFKIGDLVAIEGRNGKVVSMGLRNTAIKGIDSNIHIFPNSQIKIVTNLSKGSSYCFVNIPILNSVGYEKVRGVLLNEFLSMTERVEFLVENPKIEGIIDVSNVFYTVRVSALCLQNEQVKVEYMVRENILVRLGRENISPYGI